MKITKENPNRTGCNDGASSGHIIKGQQHNLAIVEVVFQFCSRAKKMRGWVSVCVCVSHQRLDPSKIGAA